MFFCSQSLYLFRWALLLSSCRWRSGWEFCCWREPSGGLVSVAENSYLGRRQLVLLYLFGRVGDSRGHVLEPDKFECFRSKRIIRKYFSCHRLRLFLLYASYLVAGHAFNPHERQADRRVPQAVGVQKLGAFRSGGAALFPAFLAKAQFLAQERCLSGQCAL